MILAVIYGCTDNLEPQDTNQIIESESQFQIGTRIAKKSVSLEVIQTDGKVPSFNVVSVQIDGQDLVEIEPGVWQIKIYGESVDNNSPAQVKSSSGGDPDCSSEIIDTFTIYHWYGTLPLEPQCYTVTETTCYETHIEDGVIVTTVTLSTSTTSVPGRCAVTPF